MFERYVENARRVIFFARYEAGANGSPYIECSHLLLGMLREYDRLRRLDAGIQEAIRADILAGLPKDQPLSQTVDLPLSREAKRALSVAAERAERRGDAMIDSGHLLFGVAQVDSGIAELLQRHGIDPQQRSTEDEEEAAARAGTAAGPLRAQLDRLGRLILDLQTDLPSDPAGEPRRKQALGPLIDSATAHHQIFVRAQVEPQVAVSALAEDTRVAGFQNLPSPRMAAAWSNLNIVIVDLLQHMPADKLSTPVRVGTAQPVPLATIIENYVAHCAHVIGRMQP